jgi:transposase
LIMLLSEGQMSDYKGAALMIDAFPKAKALLADRGYDADWFRHALAERGIAACIPSKTNRKVPIPHDTALYRQRHKVENMFGKLKDWRRIHTRYDRCAHTFMSASSIAATVIFWLPQWVLSLIFSGSLLTHFDEWQWRIYIEMCCNALSPEGVFLFTTHGRIASALAKDRHPIYGNLVDTRKLFELQKSSGFSFLPYDEKYPTFGLTLTSPAWVMGLLEKMSDINIIGFEEGGWGQDIWTVKRAPWSMVR